MLSESGANGQKSADNPGPPLLSWSAHAMGRGGRRVLGDLDDRQREVSEWPGPLGPARVGSSVGMVRLKVVEKPLAGGDGVQGGRLHVCMANTRISALAGASGLEGMERRRVAGA